MRMRSNAFPQGDRTPYTLQSRNAPRGRTGDTQPVTPPRPRPDEDECGDCNQQRRSSCTALKLYKFTVLLDFLYLSFQHLIAFSF